MSHRLNKTDGYYAHKIDSLGWELTVCNMLVHPESACRSILARDASYGTLLADYLAKVIPLDSCTSVLEVGGGYGFLMRDFLARYPALACTMLDISPFLLSRQREALGGSRAEFIVKDFFSAESDFLRRFDLVILNENIGDFPTVCDIDPEYLRGESMRDDALMRRVRDLVERYSLDPPPGSRINVNLGAVEAVEKLCGAGVPCFFMSEHSCEARVPDSLAALVSVTSPGNPERIPLKGHDEYTIKFSHLTAVGERLGYRAVRGSMTDFIPVDFDGRVRFIMASQVSRSDEHEIIRQFVEDVFKYEYVIFVKG